MVYIVSAREVIDTRELSLQCSHCRSTNQTDAIRVKTVDRLYGLIPVWVTQETVVKCPNCEATFTTQVVVDELQKLPPGEIAKEFRVRVGFVPKFMVAIGWLLVWILPVSIVLFVIARFLIPKTAVRWRRATTAGIVASIALPILFFSTLLIIDLISAANAPKV